jgi:hypothetical protein
MQIIAEPFQGSYRKLLESHHSKGDQLFRVAEFFFEPPDVRRSRQQEGEQRARRDDVGSEFYPILLVDEKPRVWVWLWLILSILQLL